MSTNCERVRLPKLEYSLCLKKAIADANKAAQTIPSKAITETNKLLYATANCNCRNGSQDKGKEP